MQFHVESLVMSGGSAAAAAATSHMDLGLPLPEVLAAFAGAALILSFIGTKDGAGAELPRWRLALMTLFCTVGGTWLGPVAAEWLELKRSSGGPGIAFALAALMQLAVPLLIAHRGDIAAWVMSLLPKRSQ